MRKRMGVTEHWMEEFKMYQTGGKIDIRGIMES
jgi:hypothetical protein